MPHDHKDFERHIRLARERAAKITTMEMLLDANWSNSNGWFIKVIYERHPNGLTSRWEHYYDETGVEIHPKTRQPI